MQGLKNSLKKNFLYPLANLINRLVNEAQFNQWLILKQKFKSIGQGSYIPYPRQILNPQYISIGANFGSLHNLRLEAWDGFEGLKYAPEIIIGNNVYFNSDCHLGCINKIVIGNDVLIASRVYISDHSHGEINTPALLVPPAKRPLVSKGPVVVEDNVWIGEGVCILAGVTIGKNSIIGANSVVTKSIPVNSVAAGIPARVIKSL